MSKLMIPIHVDVKVLSSSTMVPTLDREAFSDADHELEAGAHVHWTLPDALTTAQTFDDEGQRGVVFPAVPDLWLVVRFDGRDDVAPLAPKEAFPHVPIGSGGFGKPKIAIPKLGRSVPRTPTVGKRLPLRRAALKIKRGGATFGKFRIPRPVAPPQKPKVEIPRVPINPADLSSIFSARRHWKAWVVDSRNGTSTPLSEWSPPSDVASEDCFTAVGRLDKSASRGGYGLWNSSKSTSHPMGLSYYPESRRRFGFYDDLEDRGGSETLSYAVVGWYSSELDDPLQAAYDRSGLLEAWNLATEDYSSARDSLSSLITHHVKNIAKSPAFKVQPLKARSVPSKTHLGAYAKAPTPPIQPETWVPDLSNDVPSQIICHGAVVEVKVEVHPSEPPLPPSWTVKLTSSIKRAAAELVTEKDDDLSLLSVEAMLQDLEAQGGTTGGLLDIPGAAHELTFRTAPGGASWFAEIHINSEANATKPVSSFKQGRQEGTSRLRSGKGSLGLTPEKSMFLPLPDGWHAGGKKRALTPPTKEEVDAKLGEFAPALQSAFDATRSASLGATPSRPLDGQWLRLVDHRANKENMFGASTDGWWLNTQDPSHIRALVESTWHDAEVVMPQVSNIHEEPGPRWYRPGAPHVSIENIQRSYRHGFDGRYEPDGKLRCRLSGQTVASINGKFEDLQSPPVPARSLLSRASAFNSQSGLPRETTSLLEEVLVLDPSNADLMARNWLHAFTPAWSVDAVQQFEDQAMTWIARRQPDEELEKIRGDDGSLLEVMEEAESRFGGTLPSYIAVSPWSEPWLPVLVDVKTSHASASMTEYKLGEVELEKLSPNSTTSTSLRDEYREREFLMHSLTNIAAGQLIEKFKLDRNGNLVSHGLADFEPGHFDRTNLMSLALTKFDDQLRVDEPVRSGDSQVEELLVIDAFGTRRSWTPNGQDELHRLDWSPRLPEWARLMCRFRAADDDNIDASHLHTPVCGFLLPDHVEHTIEVFNNKGQSLGQLLDASGATGVRFQSHPWVEEDGMAAVKNSHLADVINGIAGQSSQVGEGTESALKQLMRVLDTVGGTIEGAKPGGRGVHLFGKAVAIVRTRLWLETSDAKKPNENSSVYHPPIPVQIGSVTRPDDGVCGVFVPGPTPAEARFHPVDGEVLEKAMDNDTLGSSSLDHDFFVGNSQIQLAHKEVRDLSVFVEVGASVYITSGVLPRKKLTLDPWHTAGEVQQMEPTFKVGPLLAIPQGSGENRPILPHPDVLGYDELWLEKPSGESEEYRATKIKSLPSEGLLPSARCEFTEGWVQLQRPTSENS